MVPHDGLGDMTQKIKFLMTERPESSRFRQDLDGYIMSK